MLIQRGRGKRNNVVVEMDINTCAYCVGGCVMGREVVKNGVRCLGVSEYCFETL